MKLRNKIIYLLILVFIGFAGIRCSKKEIEYTNFQKSYFSICEEAKKETNLGQADLEKLVGIKASKVKIGESKEDGNSYFFEENDESLLIFTDTKSKKVSFLKYEKVGDIVLTNSLEEGTDIGGYKTGFTSQYNVSSEEEQKSQLNLHLNDKNKYK